MVEGPHVRVVLVAVELDDEPSCNQKIHLTDTTDLHSVNHVETGTPQLDTRQRLQRAARSAARPLQAPAPQHPARSTQVGTDLLVRDPALMEGGTNRYQGSPFLGAAQKISETTCQGNNGEGAQGQGRKIPSLMLMLTP